jgi:hypothetical protein
VLNEIIQKRKGKEMEERGKFQKKMQQEQRKELN